MANGECPTCGLEDDHAVGCPVQKQCGCGMPGGEHAAKCPVKMPAEVLRDVPTTTALARSPQEARVLVRRMTGDIPPNQCRFVCIMCGWDKTLEFDDDEMATLGGDVRSYGGPCAACGSMTLAPYDGLVGKDFRPLHEMARENRREEFGEAADIFMERAEKKIGEVLAGGGRASATEKTDPTRPPGQRDDLPDDDDVDVTKLRPRTG